MENENEECCPGGEPCEEPVISELPKAEHVNPHAIPYVPSDHVKKLMEKREERNKKKGLPEIVQKKT